ncbi:hypothetical protein SAMN05445060_2141 [Williamsia sterculiae]|uniref:Uncharacterized protein n=1 Tax=Williamsia sterculiae TaxID=1344003 RepID=A0A1N7FKB5_9NOCA|nr:hypothetical protein SAMN05445060_2141 [Williamsia sterculiae]
MPYSPIDAAIEQLVAGNPWVIEIANFFVSGLP